MTTPRVIHQSIEIGAPPSTVWRVLTDSAITPQYMYGCEIVSDWVIGSAFDWRGEDGIVYVEGFLLALERDRRLQYSMIDPAGAYPLLPENYLSLTATISRNDRGSHLELETGDFGAVAEGETRYQHMNAGGDDLLVKMKEIAEGLVAG